MLQKTISGVRRVLAALFGAVLFGVLVPLVFLLVSGMPDTFRTLGLIALAGVLVGGVLGALFPRVFGAVFEFVADV